MAKITAQQRRFLDAVADYQGGYLPCKHADVIPELDAFVQTGHLRKEGDRYHRTDKDQNRVSLSRRKEQ